MKKSELRQLIREVIKKVYLKEGFDIGDIVKFAFIGPNKSPKSRMEIIDSHKMFDSDLMAYIVKKEDGSTAEYDQTQLTSASTMWRPNKSDLNEAHSPAENELRRLGIKYELSGNKNKPFEKIFKPIDKSDDFYRKFDDVVDRYGLSNSVVIQNKANLASLNHEGTCGYDTDARTGKKFKTPGGL